MMFLSQTMVIVMVIASILAAIYIILLLSSSKYNEYIKPLNNKEYPLYEVYGIGFLVLDLIRYQYTSKKDLKQKREFEILFGTKYMNYYLMVNRAQAITLSFTAVVVILLMTGLLDSLLSLGLAGMFGFVLYVYYSNYSSKLMKQRANELLRQFPDMVAKLALLINAGMIMKEAWTMVAQEGTGLLYEEMRLAVREMDNGIPELDAYSDFGKRCVIPEIKKFTSTVQQGLLKGNKEFSIMVRQQSREIWNIKQSIVKQEGAKAASKLLIPICIMFVGILIMIIIPIFSNLGV